MFMVLVLGLNHVVIDSIFIGRQHRGGVLNRAFVDQLDGPVLGRLGVLVVGGRREGDVVALAGGGVSWDAEGIAVEVSCRLLLVIFDDVGHDRVLAGAV